MGRVQYSSSRMYGGMEGSWGRSQGFQIWFGMWLPHGTKRRTSTFICSTFIHNLYSIQTLYVGMILSSTKTTHILHYECFYIAKDWSDTIQSFALCFSDAMFIQRYKQWPPFPIALPFSLHSTRNLWLICLMFWLSFGSFWGLKPSVLLQSFVLSQWEWL